MANEPQYNIEAALLRVKFGLSTAGDAHLLAEHIAALTQRADAAEHRAESAESCGEMWQEMVMLIEHPLGITQDGQVGFLVDLTPKPTVMPDGSNHQPCPCCSRRENTL